MTPDRLSRGLVREAPSLRVEETVGAAVQRVLESGLPALPVVDAEERLVGIFGEREFMGALFPGYLNELKYAGFVPGTLDDALEKRAGCRSEPVRDYMHTEHIDVGTDFSPGPDPLQLVRVHDRVDRMDLVVIAFDGDDGFQPITAS